MNADIKAIVDQCKLLDCNVNKGERHKIMHKAIKPRHGCLWITPKPTYGYSVCPTGKVKALMYKFLHTHFRAEKSVYHYGKWWKITDLNDVAKIIRHFGRPIAIGDHTSCESTRLRQSSSGAKPKVNQFEIAYRAWPILIEAAYNKTKIKYGDLAKRLQIHQRPIRFVLEEIQNYCLDEKLPPLTILVENKQGVVGKGFIAWDVDDIDTGLEKVYAFDWKGVQNPFAFASDGTSPEMIASDLAKRRVNSKDIYAKVQVRGPAQMIFKDTLIKVYGGRCAFSGYKGKSLLQAAHILPWSRCKAEERLEPRNGILLSVLHHRLFDLHWIKIDENYQIHVNQKLIKNQSLSKDELALLAGLDGKE